MYKLGLHGAAFASWGEVSRDAFKYVGGEDHLKSYPFSENPESLFCDSCGSRILVESQELRQPDKQDAAYILFDPGGTA